METKEEVKRILQMQPTFYFSGQQLADKLGVSRNAIWKAVRQLQAEGYPIESRQKLGYRMERQADYFSPEEIQQYLHTEMLGKQIKFFRCTDSTNVQLKTLTREGAVHGTVVTAEMQTAGKGRQGRSFCSPQGAGLYFSVLLRKEMPLTAASTLTACAAVATARAIDGLYNTNVKIKWVNDLFLDEKKICGILTEGGVSLESGKLEYAIIGIGINIRKTQEYLPEELRDKVTSIEESSGEEVNRSKLLAAILMELESLLAGLNEKTFLEEYRRRSNLIGRTVEVAKDDGTIIDAKVLGIDDNCGLIVTETNGVQEILRAGEVHITKM